MVALDRRVLDGPVHSLDLAVGPGMARLGQAMLNAALLAGPREGVQAVEPRLVAHGPVRLSFGFGFLVGRRVVDELGAVVGEHGVNRVRDRSDEGSEEVGRHPSRGPLVKLDEGELARAVDGHEEVKLAFLRSHLGDVDVEVADRIGLEARPWEGSEV